MRQILFVKNHGENEVGRLVPDLFLLFKKAFYNLKASGQHLNFGRSRLGHAIKTNFITFKTVDSEKSPNLTFYKKV